MTSPVLELQGLIFTELTTDAGISAIIGNRVYDHVPGQAGVEGRAKEPTFPYVTFGNHEIEENDAECIVMSNHTQQIDVWSREPGRKQCLELVDLIKRKFHEQPFTITDNAIGNTRISFQRVFQDPDGITTHGVLTLDAIIEEN